MTVNSVVTSFVHSLEVFDELVPTVNKIFDKVFLVFAITVSHRYVYLLFSDVDWLVKVWCFPGKLPSVGVFSGFHPNKLI